METNSSYISTMAKSIRSDNLWVVFGGTIMFLLLPIVSLLFILVIIITFMLSIFITMTTAMVDTYVGTNELSSMLVAPSSYIFRLLV